MDRELYVSELEDGRLNMQEVYVTGGGDEEQEQLTPTICGKIEREPARFHIAPVYTWISGDVMNGEAEKRIVRILVLAQCSAAVCSRSRHPTALALLLSTHHRSNKQVDCICTNAEGNMQAGQKLAPLMAATPRQMFTPTRCLQLEHVVFARIKEVEAQMRMHFSETYCFDCEREELYRVEFIIIGDADKSDEPILRFRCAAAPFLQECRGVHAQWCRHTGKAGSSHYNQLTVIACSAAVQCSHSSASHLRL
jgi:hypothetical protein